MLLIWHSHPTCYTCLLFLQGKLLMECVTINVDGVPRLSTLPCHRSRLQSSPPQHIKCITNENVFLNLRIISKIKLSNQVLLERVELGSGTKEEALRFCLVISQICGENCFLVGKPLILGHCCILSITMDPDTSLFRVVSYGISRSFLRRKCKPYTNWKGDNESKAA